MPPDLHPRPLPTCTSARQRAQNPQHPEHQTLTLRNPTAPCPRTLASPAPSACSSSLPAASHRRTPLLSPADLPQPAQLQPRDSLVLHHSTLAPCYLSSNPCTSLGTVNHLSSDSTACSPCPLRSAALQAGPAAVVPSLGRRGLVCIKHHASLDRIS